MKRIQIIVLAILGIGAAAVAESYLGSTSYRLNDATYAVPHKYEFMRNFRQRDPTTGWDRVYWLVGQKGTPGEGGSLFYLIPRDGVESLPPNWRVPSCQASPDIKGHERFDCSFTISAKGLTFDFSLRQENLGTANRIPEYVLRRLKGWQV